jgi:hypothetical protein
MSIDGTLSFEDGEVRLDSQSVPGILVSHRVTGAVRFDRAEQDGLSGTVKVPLGWTDADITLVLDLLSDDSGDCYDKLADLNGIFKGADNGANPRIYTLTGRHARARGIDQVVFSGLDSDEDDQSDVLRVTLAFGEYRPAIVRQEEQVAAAGSTASPSAATVTPAGEPAILADGDNPFASGFEAGAA